MNNRPQQCDSPATQYRASVTEILDFFFGEELHIAANALQQRRQIQRRHHSVQCVFSAVGQQPEIRTICENRVNSSTSAASCAFEFRR